MSHSKMTKRGRSQYLENWNPAAKKYINICKICGHKGYSPAIDEEDFCDIFSGNWAIRYELKSTLERLELDELGRCGMCARVHDKKDGD